MGSRILFLAVFVLAGGLLAWSPSAASDGGSGSTVIPVHDSRSGDGPCGFSIRRDLRGTVTVTPSLDQRGNLVLTVDGVDLRGTIANPETGQSVEILWVHQNGTVAFVSNGSAASMLLQLTGTLNRGYDTADGALTMDLPRDGAGTVAFVPGEHQAQAWAQVCAMLG